MTKKININESSAWSELDWDEPSVPAGIKTDQQVAVSRASKLRIRSDVEKQKISESNKRFRKENPRSEKEKKACGNNMRGKSLEDILGEKRAAEGRKIRAENSKGPRPKEVGEKIAATRKAKGSYDGRSMKGKTHKESTKEMQSKKAQIRQDLKYKLGLGRNDSVPKDLLEKEYKKYGL